MCAFAICRRFPLGWLLLCLPVLTGYTGDVYFTIVANSFIHLLMYYYYLVSTVSKAPSWGKYLTQLQMVQFVLMNLQAGYILINHCAFPRKVTLVYLVYIISLLVLFMQFYTGKHSKGPKPLKKD